MKIPALIYITNNFLITIVSVLTFIGTTFFLWQEGQSLERLFLFNSSIFLGTLLATIPSGFISAKINPKISFLLAHILVGAYNIYLYLNSENVDQILPLIGIGLGCYYSFLNLSIGVIQQAQSSFQDFAKFGSYIQVSGSLVSIALPILLSFLIQDFGYQNLFLINSSIALTAFILALFVKAPTGQVKESFPIIKIFVNIFKNDVLRSIWTIQFSIGIATSFMWGILDILILDKIGSLDNWSIFSTIFAILGIIISLILGRISIEQEGKRRVIIATAALFFGISPIILVSSFTVGTFLMFSGIKLFFEKTNGILTNTQIYDYEHIDPLFKERRTIYQTFIEIAKGLGLILPVLIFTNLPTEFLTVDFLIISMSIFCLFPLINLSSLKIRGKRIANYW